MPTVMVCHDVKDTKHWLVSPVRKQVLEPVGVTNIRTFTDPQTPNRVGLVMEVADMQKLMAFMQTKAAADAMASDGVLPETMMILVQS
ncbi:hypothetical protein B5K08_28925 [Rhizobium leguminosarum bv. trifolii]|uniref:Uncharacterized protein n=1 Tax=Rhizobium leguminosarum bv. trifolii TaxID=386 RepID=A0A3E1B1V8_RHILT|nr:MULTISPECIES: hypothetical protein [Rhizobium]ANM14772.1 hypothetical protein AMK05_PE00404 [Rhizobium sp. N324]ANM21161.1 hypothetical protein AMK06_PE00401 [Rhizobium sp. N541]ANM27532.1 hypothetical protein AMK07_PE00401 [Rhizobium sp. N941]OWV91789.1 hypothetical protein ATY75_01010 [Rhizobium sp. N122]OYC99875.1 hypothetical protein AMK08_PE00402 [Rhizobium sp. N4311]